VRDTTVPSKPTNVVASGASGYPALTWTASTDNVGVAGYIIYRSTNGTQGAEVGRTSAAVRQWDRSELPGKVKYTYSLKAFDSAGNLSALSALRAVTASQAPSPPSLTLGLSSGKPQLNWTASTDNVGVTGYIVYRSTTAERVVRSRARVALVPRRDGRARRQYTYNVRRSTRPAT
jgi:hypothetical protein